MIDITKYSPCSDGLEYYQQFSSVEDAWNSCQRGDWMLWFSQKVGVDKKKLTLAKGLCAKTVIHLMDQCSIDAVNAAIDYGRGIIDNQLKKHADAISAYADVVDVFARAAAYVDAADAAADVAEYAAYAAANVSACADAGAAAHAASAADDARAASDAAAAAAACAAAYAAACADADVAAYAATDAANAAAYAAYAADDDDDAYADALISNLNLTADICRHVLTEDVFKMLNITGNR